MNSENPVSVTSRPAGPEPVYRVLARKYRPSSFEDLIGQEPMVRTLTNAFALNRIHQAYILTGVRGVGKTTTARILARAFNYQLPGQPSQPSVHMPVLGVHCAAIIESRHVDVIEMDAASHTGIDDVREIIENARYLPVMASKKIYIIDEVHMLSKQAFNGLLKTLEEPPEHVRFLFATTEIEKVPITVRSRCQRFDLRRIESGAMVAHLAGICKKENIPAENEALAMISRASEGSVRDALSLLDQAIAHGAGQGGIKASILSDMLGLADRSRIMDLFEAVMKGDAATALSGLKHQHDSGADPTQILTELAEFVHLVTRIKLVPMAANDISVTREEIERGADFAGVLGLPVLTRAWQILVKGLSEIKDSPRPLASADMVLVRLCYAAGLPTPEEALRKLATQGNQDVTLAGSPRGAPLSSAGPRAIHNSSAAPRHDTAVSPAPPEVRFARFEDVVAHAAASRDIQLKTALERDIRLVRFEQGTIELSLVAESSPQIVQTLMRRLQEWTGQRWIVAVSSREGQPTIEERTKTRETERRSGLESDPLVRSVLQHFPGARIVAVRTAGESDVPEIPDRTAGSKGNPATADEVVYPDMFDPDDDL